MKVTHAAMAVLVAARGIGVDAQTRPSGPAPGVMVDLGGRRMHVLCTGAADASPAVVLLPGGGGLSSTWSGVQRSLPDVRTCAYDPPGLGWSDAASVPRTLHQDAFDLNRLLERGGVRPPLILVGHSVGGLVARLYAAQFPGVAAVILVDALHEDSTQFNTGVNRWVRIRELATGKTIPRPAVGTASATNPSDDFLPDELQHLHDMRLPKTATLGDLPLRHLGR